MELTRNPVGLEQALAKIALDTEPLEVANRATQHLYFENPIKGVSGKRSDLFSTHPPVIDRINRLRALQGQGPIDNPQIVLGLASVGAAVSPRPPVPPAGPPAGPPVRTAWTSARSGTRNPGSRAGRPPAARSRNRRVRTPRRSLARFAPASCTHGDQARRI